MENSEGVITHSDLLDALCKENPDTIGNHEWRMSHLYHITTNKDGGNQIDKVFSPNWAQEEFSKQKSRRNIILKARQLGFSTYIQLYMLDNALFKPNMNCDVITYNEDLSKSIFDKKIVYAYEHLPEFIKKARPKVRGRADELKFSNNSSIRCSVSSRGGTVDILHVSEYGKMCAKFPEKAVEIKAGSMQAVGAGGEIFIESTAEGCTGDFYDMYMEYRGHEVKDAGMDYKTFFYPWYRDPSYYTDISTEISLENQKYFNELEKRHDIKLTNEQKWWYVKKQRETLDKTKQEYPSFDEEAFANSTKGSIYGDVIAMLKEEGHIKDVPYDSSYPVFAFYDLGWSKGNATSVCFVQFYDNNMYFIDCYEEEKKSVQFFCDYMKKRPYMYGAIFLPIDSKQENGSNAGNSSYRQFVESADARVEILPKVPNKIALIDVCKKMLMRCYFDKTRCAPLITALSNYRKMFNEKRGVFNDEPFHDKNSNYADSFSYVCFAVDMRIDLLYSKRYIDRNYEDDYRQEAPGDNYGWY